MPQHSWPAYGALKNLIFQLYFKAKIMPTPCQNMIKCYNKIFMKTMHFHAQLCAKCHVAKIIFMQAC